MKVLGIDPGTTRVGFGVVEYARDFSLVDYGVIEVQSKAGPKRILELGNKIKAVLRKTEPDLVGIETIFFSKNKKTALSVAEARGAIMHIVSEAGVKIREVSPGRVKAAVTGYAGAEKKAVGAMVKRILRAEAIAGHDDAADALAIAIAAILEKDFSGV